MNTRFRDLRFGCLGVIFLIVAFGVLINVAPPSKSNHSAATSRRSTSSAEVANVNFVAKELAFAQAITLKCPSLEVDSIAADRLVRQRTSFRFEDFDGASSLFGGHIQARAQQQAIALDRFTACAFGHALIANATRLKPSLIRRK